jgi:hypothetical protein
VKRWPLVLLVVSLVGGVSCSGGPVDEDLDTGDGKEDRGGALAFHEVDPSHTSASFRRYVRNALALLEDSDAEIARLTAQAIRDGRVEIDELVDLTCWDFERARKDLTSVELESADWRRLHDPASPVARAFADELDGYMWQNRIYVSRGQTARRLAATLVHEVNHVINRSEVGYYDDLPTSAFLHEVRAFHAESLFDPDTYDGVDLASHVITLYELDREAIDEAVLAHPITPRLLPDARAWRDRRVEDDPVDKDEDCPGF